MEGDSEEEVRDTEEEGDDEDGDVDKEGGNFGDSNLGDNIDEKLS